MIQIVLPSCLSCTSTVWVSAKRTVQIKVHTHYRCGRNIMSSCLLLKCQSETNPGTAVVPCNVTELARGMRASEGKSSSSTQEVFICWKTVWVNVWLFDSRSAQQCVTSTSRPSLCFSVWDRNLWPLVLRGWYLWSSIHIGLVKYIRCQTKWECGQTPRVQDAVQVGSFTKRWCLIPKHFCYSFSILHREYCIYPITRWHFSDQKHHFPSYP